MSTVVKANVTGLDPERFTAFANGGSLSVKMMAIEGINSVPISLGCGEVTDSVAYSRHSASTDGPHAHARYDNYPKSNL